MNRDLRDPKALGEYLLQIRAVNPQLRMCEVADTAYLTIRNYSSNLGPIQKYGRPQDLPSTLPN